MSDRIVVYISSALRGLATGFLGVTFALYLHNLQFTATEIGLFISLGLGAGAIAVTAVSLWGDRMGRKRTYFFLTGLMLVGGIALGALAAGIPALLKTSPLLPYWGLISVSLVTYKFLSSKIEVDRVELNLKISAETKTRVKKLMALFGLDALSTGFMSTAFLAYFFHQKFGLSAAALGSLFAAARTLSANGGLGVAASHRRISGLCYHISGANNHWLCHQDDIRRSSLFFFSTSKASRGDCPAHLVSKNNQEAFSPHDCIFLP